MSTHARYVFAQIAKPLIAAMAIGLSVLMAERLVRLLDITLGKKNSISIVFEMLTYLVPHYLGLAMPAAFFLGLLFGFSRLSRDSEISAFLAGGISLHQLTMPVIMLGIAFAVLSTVIVGFVQPHTRYAFRAVVHEVKNVQIFYLAEEGVFMRASKHTFIVDKLSRPDNRFERIFVFSNTDKGTETITARSGALVEIEGEPRPVLRLDLGNRLKVEGKVDFAPDAVLPRPLSGEFKLVDTPLGTVDQTLFRPRGKDHRELTLTELAEAMATPQEDLPLAKIRAEFHRRLAAILAVMVLPLLAIPFALQTGRHQRPYRFAAAMIILIVYHEATEQGALLARLDQISPLIGLWLPLGILTVFAAWRYYTHCFRLRTDMIDRVLERVSQLSMYLRRKIAGLEGST